MRASECSWIEYPQVEVDPATRGKGACEWLEHRTRAGASDTAANRDLVRVSGSQHGSRVAELGELVLGANDALDEKLAPGRRLDDHVAGRRGGDIRSNRSRVGPFRTL